MDESLNARDAGGNVNVRDADENINVRDADGNVNVRDADGSLNTHDAGTELFDLLDRTFHTKQQDIRTYSPLTLAYIGDAVYELLVRSLIVRRGNAPVNKLNRYADELECARRQALIADAVEEGLTEEEHHIFTRGRNAKSPTRAKNASIAEYRKATGLEALFGYLYLTDRLARAVRLLQTGIEATENL